MRLESPAILEKWGTITQAYLVNPYDHEANFEQYTEETLQFGLQLDHFKNALFRQVMDKSVIFRDGSGLVLFGLGTVTRIYLDEI